eukprot:sb/3467476/
MSLDHYLIGPDRGVGQGRGLGDSSISRLDSVVSQPCQLEDSQGSSRSDTLDVILEKQKKVLHGEEGRTLKYIPKSPLRVPLKKAHSRSDTLDVILEKQKKVLHGEEGRTLKYIPKVVFVICSSIISNTGHSSSLLCKRFHPLSPSRRPMTCQPALEWETRDVEDDLDSLSGDNKGCTNDLSEVEEMEAQMTPRGEAAQEEDTMISPSNEEGTTPIRPSNEEVKEDGIMEIKSGGKQDEGEAGTLRRCVSASAILIHDHKEGVTEEQEISLQLSHRLHLSPRSSFDHYDNKKRTKV